jgi:uncharacterized membrane protein YcaP (DUF421 family)
VHAGPGLKAGTYRDGALRTTNVGAAGHRLWAVDARGARAVRHHQGETMDTLLTDLLTPGIPIIEKIVRPVAVYVFLIVGIRLAGKRELAQLNPFDLVVLLTLSNTVQNAIIGNDNSLAGGLIGATALLVVNYLVVRWAYRHPAVGRLVEGSPTVLVDHGKAVPDRLARELITESDLLIALRRQGFQSIDDVETAVLEPGGVLTFEARKHPTHVKRHTELVEKLDQLKRMVEDLRGDLAKA